MPKSCCVSNCSTNKKKNPDLKFFCIPITKTRRERWLTAINRAVIGPDGSVRKDKLWSPKSGYTYVCSLHFITGTCVNDPSHPDFAPSIFPSSQTGTDDKSTAKLNRYERAKKRKESDCTPDAPRARKKLKLTEATVTSEEQDAATEEPEILVATPLPMKKAVTESEREILYKEIENLRKERDEANKKVKELEQKCNLSSLSFDGLKDDETCQNLTGLEYDVLVKLYGFLASKVTSVGTVPPRDQFVLTLVKLKHDVSFDFLSNVKGIPKSTVINYFWKWINLINAKAGFYIQWADRETIFKDIPPEFKRVFPRLTSIIDCFEIFIEAPKRLHARAQCYSSYKKHCTVKYLISCAPFGGVNFISRGFGGRASDVKIVRESGFISYKYHLPGDQILADRGFTMQEESAVGCGAELLTPAFTKGKKQLSAKEVETSRKLSTVRIHVERVIGLLKNRFIILKGPIPVRCVQSLTDESLDSKLASCDKIVRVCAILTNLSESIVYRECE